MRDECDAEIEVVQVDPLAITEVVDEYEDLDEDPEEYEYVDDEDYGDDDYYDDDYDDDGYDDMD